MCRFLEIITRYKKVAGAKINVRKRKVCVCVPVEVMVLCLIPIRWNEGPSRILGVWFIPNVLLRKNWSEVQAKIKSQVDTWLRTLLFLKARASCTSRTSSPWFFTGYLCFLYRRTSGWCWNDSSSCFCGRVVRQWFPDKSVVSVLVRLGKSLACWKARVIVNCWQEIRHGDERLRLSFMIWNPTLGLRTNVGRGRSIVFPGVLRGFW